MRDNCSFPDTESPQANLLKTDKECNLLRLNRWTLVIGGEGEMVVVEDRLVPLGTLCARVRLLLDLFEHEGTLKAEWWSGVSNLLLPAACLSGVETNASVADLYDAGLYCSSAADYDDRQSNLLNDYLSVLARFHFVWAAFEAIRRQSDAGHLLTSKYLGDRKALAECVPPVQLELLDRDYRRSLSLAQSNETILRPLMRGSEKLVIGKAGLLAAGFRNYIFHGHDAPPIPDDQNDQFRAQLAGEEVASWPAYRMACFTRLTFILILILTHAEVRGRHDVEFADVPFLRRDLDGEFRVPSSFVLNLATCWPEKSSRRLSRRMIIHLATGCEVSGEVLELVLKMAVGAG